MSRVLGRTLAVLGLVTLPACADPTGPDPDSLAAVRGAKVAAGATTAAATYILRANGDALPAGLAARVQAAGGTVERTLPAAGIAIVSSDRANFVSLAARIGGVASVTRDVTVQSIDPVRTQDVEADATPINPLNDPFYSLLWWPDAIDAPEAWALGATGEGVRVAVLDGGFFVTHPDLAANFDLAASRSFVAGQPYNNDTGTFWHGTHVAGIIAAADNSLGVIGVAPRATLIGIKVLHNGSGSFSAILAAIYYAATPLSEGGAGADVINMSLGAIIPEKAEDKEDRKAIREELIKAMDRATRYAWQQGVTVVASAGNDTVNFFSAEARHYAVLPAESQHVIGVSATGPVGWAATGATDFDRQASYTNFGKQLVDLSAPGGDAALPGNANCRVGTVVAPCWVFDMVLSTSRGGYSWASGTSMAAPIVSGVAALVIGVNGGEMHPAQVAAILEQTAIDLGKPGYDDVYGHGFVNAYQAVLRAEQGGGGGVTP